MEAADDIFDITFVGGGPVGLYGAYCAGLRGMRAKIIEALPELGGQLVALYPEKTIYDVAGFAGVTARELARALIEQAMHVPPIVCLKEIVLTYERDEGRGCLAVTTDKGMHYTKTIVLCAGAGTFAPKKVELNSSDLVPGEGVYYHVIDNPTDRAQFADQRVLIVGGSDAAIDAVLQLSSVARRVTLIHRSNRFRTPAVKMRRLLDLKVEVEPFWQIKKLEFADGNKRVSCAALVQTQTGIQRKLDIDSVLVLAGYSSSLGAIQQWPVRLNGSDIAVNTRMQTELLGVFAAGDASSYPDKLKLLVTGFGEVSTAVNHAKVLIEPGSKYFPGHSSEYTAQPMTVLTDSGEIDVEKST